MNKTQIKIKLEEIFKEVFDNPKLVLKNTSNSKSIRNWDSFAQMTLILSIELSFKISFSSREIEKLKNVGEMIDLINKKKK